jgi:hypothetical protein
MHGAAVVKVRQPELVLLGGIVRIVRFARFDVERGNRVSESLPECRPAVFFCLFFLIVLNTV